MMEAMSAGCLLIGSNTPPVREMIVDGKNGLLVDFYDVAALAERTVEVLSRPQDFAGLRQAARQTILDGYDWHHLLPKQLDFLQQMAIRAQQQARRRCAGR